MSAAPVNAERILKDLAELWTTLAAEAPGKTSTGVLRACSMTLLVAAEDVQDTANVEQTVAELMHEHPSRAIVLKPAGPSGDLDARVFAQCWMPFGGRQQICCEEIEIATPADGVDEAARVIVGLVAPDLPVVLWCRGRRWFEKEGIDRLYALADKVILDSCSFDESESVFRTIATIRRRAKVVADLAWTRLTGWREIIAHAFDGPRSRVLKTALSATVEHYGDTPSAAARYLGAWLGSVAPRAEVAFHPVQGEQGQVAGAHLVGPEFEMTFRRVAGNTIHVTGSAHLRSVVLPHATDYHSMREELAITGIDPIFQKIYPVAERMAAK